MNTNSNQLTKTPTIQVMEPINFKQKTLRSKSPFHDDDNAHDHLLAGKQIFNKKEKLEAIERLSNLGSVNSGIHNNKNSEKSDNKKRYKMEIREQDFRNFIESSSSSSSVHTKSLNNSKQLINQTINSKHKS